MVRGLRHELSIKLDLLVAYPYLKNKSTMMATRKAAESGHRIWVDSGAFTTYKAGGQPTEVAEYISFIKSLEFRPERIFTLDVIGDPVATKQNHDRLLDAGIRPVPILTPGAPIESLDEMYEHSDLVAVGGLNSNKGAGGGGPGWAKYVLEHERRPLHLLGFVNKAIIAKYKPYSIDASTWEYAGRVGTIKFYMGHGRLVCISRHQCSGPLSNKQTEAIKAYGLSTKVLLKEDNWRGGRSLARHTGCRATIRFVLDIYKQFGTRYVLACAGSGAFEMIANAIKDEEAYANR